MQIHIKATQLALTPTIKTFVEEKIGGLEKFIGRYDAEGGVETWVEVGRTTMHHHKGDVFRAEADMRLPGKVLRAEDENSDIYVAIDNVRDRLKREIEKYKETHE